MSSLWLDFFNMYLWLNFLMFMASFSNMMNLLLFCELFWVIFFLNFSVLSMVCNSMLIFLMMMVILTMATMETSMGLSMIILKSSMYGTVSKNSLILKKNMVSFNFLKMSLMSSKLHMKWSK